MKKPRHLSPDEKALWDSVAKQTIPFQDRATPKTVETKKPQSPKIQNTIQKPFRIGENTLSSIAPAKSLAFTMASPAMDAKAFSNLKKGRLKPEARIDLHGMTVAQAHPALIRFILNAHQQGRRLVLVITGKGRGATNLSAHEVQRGVLRRQVPHWLSMSPLRETVLQTYPANVRHGGDGAMYVYLRRPR